MFDERGVSPVVGTILLVALTILLAGILAHFVIHLTDEKIHFMNQTLQKFQTALKNNSPYSP